MKGRTCYNCDRLVARDVVALNKKMIGHHTERVLCITCLADHLDHTEASLRDLIREFKERGCSFFA